MNLPELDTIELRVLSSLIEKSRTTPDYYPMTLNGLTAACNQKTSRNPVVSYHEETVSSALNSLKKRNLVSTSFEGSSRVLKYRQNFGAVFPLVPSEVAILCILILRGAQTPGEINTNSGRLHEFESIEEIVEILDKLAGEVPPYVIRLPKRAGQKEGRYAHLLGGSKLVDEEEYPEVQLKNTQTLEIRVKNLEEELNELKMSVNALLERGKE